MDRSEWCLSSADGRTHKNPEACIIVLLIRSKANQAFKCAVITWTGTDEEQPMEDMENQAKGQMSASTNSLPRWQKQLDVNCMCDTEE